MSAKPNSVATSTVTRRVAIVEMWLRKGAVRADENSGNAPGQ